MKILAANKMISFSYLPLDCKNYIEINNSVDVSLNGHNGLFEDYDNELINCKCMFYQCSGLTKLDLSNFDTSNVTDMRAMFFHCTNLTELDLSNFDTSNVTKMYNMFDTCTELTTLDLSGWDLSNVTDMSNIFDGCTKLTTIKAIGCNQVTIDLLNFAKPSGCTIITE